MTWPYRFTSRFDSGDATEWDQQYGATTGPVDIAHFTQLWQDHPKQRNAVPYNGAYCMRIQLNNSTDAAYVEDQTLDAADDSLIKTRFRVYVGTDIANSGTASETIELFHIRSSGTRQVAFGIQVGTNGSVTFGAGKTASTTSIGSAVPKGEWYTVEQAILIDTATAGNGTIATYITGERGYSVKDVTPQVTGSVNAVVTLGRLGLPVGGTTGVSGLVLIDDLIYDVNTDPPAALSATRMHSFPGSRWNTTVNLDASGFAFVGPGRVCGITLVGDGLSVASPTGDDFLRIYDTNFMRTDGTNLLLDEGESKASLRVTTGGEIVEYVGGPFNVKHGCFVHLGNETGNAQAPRAIIQFEHAAGYGSPGAIRNYASKIGAQDLFRGAAAGV